MVAIASSKNRLRKMTSGIELYSEGCRLANAVDKEKPNNQTPKHHRGLQPEIFRNPYPDWGGSACFCLNMFCERAMLPHVGRGQPGMGSLKWGPASIHQHVLFL